MPLPACWRRGRSLGVGPDNYRLLYGEYAGLSNFDRRVHSNNMYIEMLVGGGIIGGAAFAWLCWAAARQLAAAVRASRGTSLEPAVGAIAAATLAIALHGLVDSFLSFTATYILIAVTLGLLSFSGIGRMRIAFDGTTLRPGRTGVGYYTEHLLHHLAAQGRRRRVVVISNRPVDTTRPLPSQRADRDARRGGSPRMVWMQTLAPRLLRHDAGRTSCTSPTGWCRWRRRCRRS